MKKSKGVILFLATWAIVGCFGTETIKEDGSENDSSSSIMSSEESSEDQSSSSAESSAESSSESSSIEESSSSEESSTPESSSSDPESSQESSSSSIESSTESSSSTLSSSEISSSSEPEILDGPAGSPVAKFGFLKSSGKTITSVKTGEAIQLIGMSMFWSQWTEQGSGGSPTFYTTEVVNWLVSDWKIDIIRAAIGIHDDQAAGADYRADPETNWGRLEIIVNAAVEKGIYVIIDWHSHEAHHQTNEAKAFFKKAAETWGDLPNIIYEIYNEPEQVGWGDIKGYMNEVIAEIRKYDTKNHIAVGSPMWSSYPGDPAGDPPTDPSDNLSYTMHFYAQAHKGDYRERANGGLNANKPVFATEWGSSGPVDQSYVDVGSTNEWLDYMKTNKISWCNWSVYDKAEANSSLNLGASISGGWGDGELSESGKLLRNYIRENSNWN